MELIITSYRVQFYEWNIVVYYTYIVIGGVATFECFLALLLLLANYDGINSVEVRLLTVGEFRPNYLQVSYFAIERELSKVTGS